MAKSYTLKVKGTIEIAHRLPNYNGACKKLHGHGVHYTLNFKGELQDNGMVEDFIMLRLSDFLNIVNYEKIVTKM